jgi:predicted house-cleaning noncanonical NTP pyrophosphatase (MazG superfamily)
MRMTKNYKKLNEEFNVSDDLIKPEVIEPVSNSELEIVEQTSLSRKDIEKDYEYTRGNLYSLIEKGQEAINGILELAQESELPRAYEVAGQLIKNVADATDKLMDLQKKLKEVEEGKTQKGPTNVTNALFVGSTAELAKLLKQQSQSNLEQ